MDKLALINRLISDTEEVKSEAAKFKSLDREHLYYKPDIHKWSVLECIEHLNIADAHYITQFEKKLSVAPSSDSTVFKPGWMGNYFVNMIKPKEDGTIPSPMKTWKRFVPEVHVQHDTLSKFIEDQDYLLNALEKSKSLDLNTVKITSALGSILTFKLGDAFRFLIGHNQRHLIQAKNVLNQLDMVY